MKDLLSLIGNNHEHVAIVRVQQLLIEKKTGIKYGQGNIFLYVDYDFWLQKQGVSIGDN